jgi:hypothetical protein
VSQPSGGGRPKIILHLNHWATLQYAARTEAVARQKLVTYVARTEAIALQKEQGLIPTAVAYRLQQEEHDAIMRTDRATSTLLWMARNKRRQPTKQTCADLLQVVVERYGGMCPCCMQRRIVGENRIKNGHCHNDHWYSVAKAKVHQVWPVCDKCNAAFESGRKDRTEYEPAFASFQLQRRKLFPDGEPRDMFG